MSTQRVIGDYRIGRRIAVGGMAEVFAARRVAAGESRDGHGGGEQSWPLVLKLMLPAEGADPEFARMFADEGRLAATLDHPGLVRVLEYGEHGVERFIAMERVEGVSLARLLRGCGTLPAGLALSIAEQLLEALDHIHSRTDEQGRALGIVHRDVTPGNVLLSRDGRVKLGDFGIARSRLQRARTRTGVIKGTVQYMAPEQVTDSGLDPRTDLYAVGLVLFEMLTGRRFLDAEREVDLIRLAENPSWTPPSSIGPGEVDPALDRLVELALARFPEERYGSARSFLGALRRVRQRLELGSFAAAELGALVASVVEEGPEERATAVEQTATVPDRGSGFGARASGPPGSEARARDGAEPALGVWPALAAGARRWWRRSVALALTAAALTGAVAWLVLRQVERAPSGLADPVVAVVATEAGVSGGRLDSAAAQPDTLGGVAARDSSDARAPDGGGVAAGRRLASGARRAVRRRDPRSTSVPVGRSDAGSGVEPGHRADAGSAAVVVLCRQRLARARAGVRARGIRDDDLPRALQQQLAVASRSCPGGETGALAALEAALAAVIVDRVFIQSKLGRVDRRLRALTGRRDRQLLRDKASLALQAFLDGQYELANRRLNRILQLLESPGSQPVSR